MKATSTGVTIAVYNKAAVVTRSQYAVHLAFSGSIIHQEVIRAARVGVRLSMPASSPRIDMAVAGPAGETKMTRPETRNDAGPSAIINS